MEPRIETLTEKQLVGKQMPMSLANNKTAELWRSFMPRRHEISNRNSTDLYSLQMYAPDHFAAFDLHREFIKWAGMEVTDFQQVPAGMETFVIPGGLYAVFDYKGDASQAGTFFRQIFGTWLPASKYELDDRPHFEILGEKYRNNDPNSEEEIWIPVKPKAL